MSYSMEYGASNPNPNFTIQTYSSTSSPPIAAYDTFSAAYSPSISNYSNLSTSSTSLNKREYEGGVLTLKRDDPLQQFETGRIKHLQEERLHIQKKTFTKWINSFLSKARLEIEDLFYDLGDGKMLLKLLEIISGEKLGKPNNGKMRVHKVENVNKSLAFLHTKVRLESIGAEDIVDGNPRLILGLIWTIILRFHIQEIEINLDEENESSEKKSAKDALLLWCQRKTAGYKGVTITDFTGSWRNGLGFNALIHAHRADLVDYDGLDLRSHIDNLNNAFRIAHEDLGIARILDAEDVDTSKPDEKSVITYVASYYHTFARMRDEMKGSRRIANIMNKMKDVDDSKARFERITTNLLEWIRRKISELDDRNFPNSLDGIQKLLIEFKTYRTEEKPPKYMECSEIEALFFSINASLKALNQPTSYMPKDGLLIKDIEREWEKLVKAEHRREVALRDELMRQERLEHLAFKFEKKSVLRKGYLEEMIQVLSDPRYGSNLAQVDATVKKHEAISADILARQERFEDLTKMADELDLENYHGKDTIRKKEKAIMIKWQILLELLERHKHSLQQASLLMVMLREADTILDTMKELFVNFRSDDVGGFLIAVEDLIQKHALMESQINSMGETIKRLNKQGTAFVISSGKHKDIPVLEKKLAELNQEHQNLVQLAAKRKAKLEEARNFYIFQVDMEEEDAWVIEKQRICQTGVFAKDFRSVMALQQKHKTLMDEMRARRPKSNNVIRIGEDLCRSGHPKSSDIKEQVETLGQNWKTLENLAAIRKKQLEDAAEAHSFMGDANETESWIKEKIPLVQSNDFGVDEPSAQALLQLNSRLQGEIKVYDTDIKSLNDLGQKLVKSGITSLNLTAAPQQQSLTDEKVEPEFEYVEELVAQEYFEEVVTQKAEEEFVTEEKMMEMVKARYPFDGQGMVMAKGEEMFLLSKTNNDWWNVKKSTGEEGFVPANYVKEIEPKMVKMRVKKVKKLPVVEKVKKTRMVKQKVKRKKPKAPPRKRPLDDTETVEKRLKVINASYGELTNLAELRTKLLKDSIKLFAFYRECSGFDQWMRDQEKLLKMEEPSLDVEAAKRKFEQFLTDLSAANKRIENIDKMADDLVTTGHSQVGKVRSRQKQIHDQWDHLNRLKQQKERSLEGASSVELFHRTCDEARDWMVEKMEKLDTDELGRDLKTIQALQRKHDQLERELAPVEDKVNRVKNLANSVKASYPHERKTVEVRQGEILDLWNMLKGKAIDRRNRLEEAVGNEIFLNSCKNLLNWVGDVKQALNSDEPARDVSTAEKLLENHNDLGDDIRAHQDEFKEINDLGKSLVKRNPDLVDVKEKIALLGEEQDAINRGWQEKGDWLRQCLDLQLFNREADNIDAATSSHEAFLDFADLGSTLDDVEALLKRHDDFENTLIAQDERLRTFSEMAQKLIAADHYDAQAINDRRNQVVKRRVAVKNRAQERRSVLDASMAYQQFKADADDFEKWMIDKKKTADDESYKDLNNLERKLQKHEAFEREIRANEGQLRRLNKTGDDLIGMKHYRADVIRDNLDRLNLNWKALMAKTMERGKKLHQAYDQLNYNKNLEDTAKNLDALELVLKNKDVGNDLRSCKDLLNKQTVIENDIASIDKKLCEADENGRQMAMDGHFHAANIMSSINALKDRFSTIKGPAALRRAALEESLRFHEFNFTIEAERQWIQDRIPAATSQVLGQTLHEAQNLQKKHRKLEAEIQGHVPQIIKTLGKGSQLIEEHHPERLQIEYLCKDLEKAWEELNEATIERNRKLELNLKAQHYFFEANEVESWMNERRNLLEMKDYGKDEDVARKKLAKHKALELEIDTYAGLVKEMGANADSMIKSHHPESKLIKDKQQVISHDLVILQKVSAHLRQKLMESLYRHEYFREAEDLEKWIAEQMQTASSEDFGHDYEHLLILQAKFDDFKHRVEASSERFNQCEELARKLIANESPYAAEIDKKKDMLGAAWNHLLEVIRDRDEKLEAAGEIHRFNRDVSEALSRIQEKYKSIPADLGKDVNSVQSLIRKHEGFENDLVALEAQLQVLVDDAAVLHEKYPGSNTEHIAEQQTLVVDNWNALQEKAISRRNELQEAEKLHKFLAQSRDLMSWSSDLRSSMKTHEKVRDAASAQALKGEHERIKAEIEAREDMFQKVVDQGQSMVDNNHYASHEILDRVNKVLEERNQLHAAWQNKKVYLDQLIDLQFFLRDVKQLDSICIAQEAALSTSECGETIEEVDAIVKKHLAFEKVVNAQEDKLELLKLHGAKLIEQNHFYSPNIKSHIDEVADRRGRVKNATLSRKQQLEDAQLYIQFVRDASDANVWIDEKTSYLESEKQKGEVTSFEDKVKKLQKHQAFMAEIQAHESRIKEIVDKGNLLISKRHPSSSQVRDQVRDLSKSWKHLVEDTQAHFRGLEEAQDILEFNTQVEKVEAWIRDKEMLVQAGDLGKDYEHCTSLQRKLEDVDSDMRVDDARFVKLNQLADKIISQGRGDNKAVQLRREDLNHKWKALKGAIDKYHRDLSGALEIHGFNRDVDDTSERISEKALMLATEDTGRDLTQVETLQRKQEVILRDMSAIEKKIREHNKTADILCQKYPQKNEPILQKLAGVEEEWHDLCQSSSARQGILSSSYTLHKFQSDLKELRKWEEDVIARMIASPLPQNSPEAEMLLQEHQERKAEIDGRKDVFRSLKRFGEKLLDGNSLNEIVKENLKMLDDIKSNVNDSWEARQIVLSQAHQLQVFLEMVEHAESWLASKEAFLANDDLGDSTASVEALIRKHEGFIKTFEAQGNKIDQLEEMASVLLKDKHYDSDGIQSRTNTVLLKRDNLKDIAELRDLKLRESKSLQQFLRNVYEVEGWITEKMQVASDECYRDPTNLQSKIQKHGAFEAELMANSGRISGVTQESEKLLSEGHYADKEIRTSTEQLVDLWKQLQDASQLKKGRLNEAYQALLFHRTLDDLDSWMDDVETQLQSEDHGKDLTSVQNLIKKHQKLEADIAAHQSESDQAKEVAHSLVNVGHFMSEEVLQRVNGVSKRYDSLHEPVQIRRENLLEAHLLQQLLRDIEDELLWLSEKEPLANSEDLGKSLTQVQSLQKKHQTLEAEVQSHEPVISSVNSRAQQMIRSGHFASSHIEEKIKELFNRLADLKVAASVRRLRLLDAIESQMFYSEANEAETWMKEKKPYLTSHDFGKDEGSVEASIKKLDHLERDVMHFRSTIDKLQNLSLKLIERGHFDAENVNQKMNNILSTYESLEMLIAKRQKRLEENKRLYRFLRECDAVMEWLEEQTAVAASEDYGHDVEHVEVLIQKFDSFMTSMAASVDKPVKIKEEASKLLEENHSEPERITEKATEVMQLYEDLKELATARQEALAGAKQVHVFDRNAEETKTWIAEKMAIISSEDYGHDLETIQGLARKHQGFERDLAAVKEQVESVVSEAKRLAELFPDAREHISVKHEETVEAWNELLEKSAQRKDKLHQAEKLQAYFDDYRELMAWINEIIAKITSNELPKDVSGSEALLTRHKEYKTEIDSRMDSLEKFLSSGNILVQQGHFMSEEIIEKISTLENRKRILLQCWESRRSIYQQNLDLRVFLRDAQLIETWIDSRETIVKDEHLGDSIFEVEELLRRHDDFLKTIDAQEDKLDPIKRFTLIEDQYRAQKKLEQDARKAEAQRKDQERMEALKRKEVLRITDARRREDERRRTQEIKFNKDDIEQVRMTVNGEFLKSPQGKDDDESRTGEEVEGMSLTRSGSHTSINSLKRGNSLRQELFRHSLHPTKPGEDIKRAESMKIDLKKPKRTPSFTTRRRTQSFRKHKRMENIDNLPPVEIQGYLERKQELQSGGKKATIRSWKPLFTVLCGQLLCFFKDDEDFYDQKAASSPVSIFQARVEKAEDYTKKKNVFRLITRDGAEFLFLASSDSQLEEWITKLTFHAELPPSMQLMSYDHHKEGSEHSSQLSVDNTVNSFTSKDSDNFSSNSTQEVRHRSAISSHPRGAGGALDPNRPSSQGLDNPLYANLEHVGDKSKPPVPPRGSTSSSSGANRSSQPPSLNDEGPIYQNRVSVVPSYEEPRNESIYQNYPSANGHRRLSADNINGGEEIPPLPSTAPPLSGVRPPMPPVRVAGRYANQPPPYGYQQQPVRYPVSHHQQTPPYHYHYPQSQQHKQPQVSRIASQYYSTAGSGRNNDSVDGIPGSRQPYSEYSSRTLSLPPGVAPPSASAAATASHRHSSTGSSEQVYHASIANQRHSSGASFDRNESSSEGDNTSATNGKEGKKKSSVFKFLSRRKGAQV